MQYYSTIKELVDRTCNLFQTRDAFIFKQGEEYFKKQYGEFQEDCNHIAQQLVKQNVTDVHIALLARTSYQGLVALFGSIFASNTCVVPDFNYTVDALEDLYAMADTYILLYDEEFKEKAEELQVRSNVIERIISIQELLHTERDLSVQLPKQEPDHPAIILFTSGTTGKSKAVVLTNENICSNACASAENYGAEEVSETYGSTSIAILPIHHSLFLAFITTHMQEAEAIYFNTNIASLMHDMQIIRPCSMTVIPVIVEQIYNEVMKQSQQNPNIPISKILRKITGGRLYGMACGSAKLDPKYIKAFWDWGIVISEGYGMTEASPTITNNNFKNFKIGSVGKPLPGIEVKIVDGEIWTKSKCVMKGYYKDEESTKEVLEDGWLKTGDLGYLDEEGFLFITGRKKNLIILSNGENVSPEELEVLLNREESISEAMVHEFHGTIAAEIYLDKWQDYSAEFLWNLVKTSIHNVNRQLPSYKKIQTFRIRKEPFPRNRMKKLLRSDLGKSTYITPPMVENRKPESELEQKIADIFQDELNLNDINVNDKFFEIGGNSLLATRVVNKLSKELNVKILVTDIFEHPSILEMAEYVEMLAPAEYAKVEQVQTKDYYKMSALQKRMYQIYQSDPESTAYNIPIFYKLERMPDIEKLKAALLELTKRHEIMRTSFHNWGGDYIQKIEEEAVIDFQFTKFEQGAEQCLAKVVEKFVKPFDLEKTPLFRVELVQCNADVYLLMDLHHIISDGTSVYLMFKELNELYTGKTLKPIGLQYKDYSEWLQKEGQKEILPQKNYWIERFHEEAPILDMPLDHPRPKDKYNEGNCKSFELDTLFTNRIQEYCLRTGNTLFSVLLSSLMCVLTKYSRQEDIVIGTSVSGRTRQETEQMLGMFVNTLPIRAFPKKALPFDAFLQEVKEDYIQALANQDYPFDELVEALHITWDMTRNPLFDVMFVLQNEETPEGRLGDIPMTFLSQDLFQDNKDAQCDLSLEVRESNGKLTLNWEYRSDLYEEMTIDQLETHFTVFLESILYDDTQKIGEISIMSEVEKEMVLTSFQTSQNSSMPLKAKDYPDTIIELFEQQVEKSPNAIAVVYETDVLTYQELNERANQVAYALRKRSIQPNDFVALIAEKSIEMIVGIYGILKSGACYVPMDPAYPKDRLLYQLEDCKPKAIVAYYNTWNQDSTDKPRNEDYQDSISLLGQLQDYGLTDDVIWLHKMDQSNLQSEPTTNPPIVNTSSDLAYVIYTSGTTGQPKGVLIEQKGLVNLSIAFNKAYKMTHSDRILQFASFCFDQSVSDIFSVLPTQSTVCIIPEEIRRDPDKLTEYVNETAVTILPLTPSYLNLLEPDKMPTVRLVDAGGEAANLEVLKQWVSAGKEAINSYGPTEVTVNSTYCYITQDTKILTIGKPLDNLNIFIMHDKNLCGIGVPGELCIAGVGVARGYLNKESLTNEKFTPNPYGEDKMYRTGDLARWLPDGTIDFLGRIDDQVKIRGYRIELGEIENVIRRVQNVKDVAVIVRKDALGENAIFAYYVAEEPLDTDFVKIAIAEKLPHYMMPSGLMQIEKIPMTTSGKLNKRALPTITIDLNEGYVAPRTKNEELLCHAFCTVLGTERIGIKDDFFEMGGHSLKATKLLNMIEEFTQIRLSVKTIMTLRTPERIAAELASQNDTTEYIPIPKSSTKEYYPMSSAQKRMYLLNQIDPDNITYNMPFGICLTGTVRAEDVKNTLVTLMERHEILRTACVLVNGEPMQKIYDSVEPDFIYLDFSSEDNHTQESLMESFVKPFDLSQAPLIRAELVECKNCSYLFFDMHHIICDGVSMNVISNEFTRIFAGEMLPPVKRHYKDYSEWMSTRDLSAQKQYWLQQFSDDIPTLDMATDFPRPKVQSYRGGMVSLKTGKRLYEKIKTYAKSQEATEYMIFLSALMVLLGKYTRQEDIVIGSPISGRVHPDTESMIGMFVNTLAMRGKPEREKTFSTFLNEMKKHCLNAFEAQEYPFEELVDCVVQKRDVSRNPLFDIMFAMQNVEFMHSELKVDDLALIEHMTVTSKFDMTFDVTELNHDFLIEIEYCSDLYKRETARRIGEHLVTLLDQITDNKEDLTIGDFEVLTQEDQQLLMQINQNTMLENNRNFGEIDLEKRDTTIIDLFEYEVSQNPNAIAVRYGKETLTYQALNEKANQLAHYLRGLNIGSNDFVALIAEKGLHMIIGIYGILKSGAAYVPIDPAYPMERLSYILDDCKPKAILYHYEQEENPDYQDSREFILTYSQRDTVPVIHLSEHMFDTQEIVNPNSITCKHDLAYVIYTSGTTGKPKGVLIEHGGLLNLSISFNRAYQMQKNDVVLQFASFCFDQSVSDIFSVIPTTSTLCLIPEGYRRDPDKLVEYVNQTGVSILPLTPSYIKLLKPADMPNIRLLDAGGEASDLNVLKKWVAAGIQVMNSYGPTEATVNTSYCYISEETKLLTIGKPLDNLQVWILDGMNMCGIGMPGELCVSGIALARGYLNRTDLTEEKFVTLYHTLASELCNENPRIYRTGDLARWLPDGSIEYLGRIDDQVKIRGYRVELGEIESVIRSMPEIKDAAVIMEQRNTDGDTNRNAQINSDPILLAFFVSDKTVDISTLRNALLEVLPKYMIPSAFMQIDKIPLTNSGKLNKKALPVIEFHPEETYLAPRNATEELLCTLFAQALQVELVGIQDDFFEIGGHSLKATKLINAIAQETGISLSISSIFRNATVEKLAEYMNRFCETTYQSIPKAAPKAYYPMSSTQKRMYVVHQMEPESVSYNMPFAIKLSGTSKETVKEALQQLLQRHEILRTEFKVIEEEPVQCILEHAEPNFTYKKINRQMSSSELTDELKRTMKQFVRPFQLSKAPLLRAEYVDLDEETYLFMDLHHIVTDGISMDILMDEFKRLCEGEELQPLTVQYKDYSEWLATQDYSIQKEFWVQQFADEIPILDMPTDFPRPQTQSYRGGMVAVYTGKDLGSAVKAFAKRKNVTEYMIFLSTAMALLGRYANQEDIVIGSPVSGRTHKDTETMLGMFVNTLAMRGKPEKGKAFSTLLEEVKEYCLQAYEYQNYPFEELVEEIDVGRDVSRNPLFDVMLVLQNTGKEEEQNIITSEEVASKFDLTFDISEVNEDFRIEIEYCSDLFLRETIEQMGMRFLFLLSQVVENDSISIGQLNLMTETDKKQIAQLNDTKVSYDTEATLVSLFEKQVANSPDTIAVICGDVSITYAQLNEQANRIAYLLRQQGIERNSIVPIIGDRSVYLISGILGILKSGAAYLPLDPEYPNNRISYMLSHSRATCVVAEEKYFSKLPETCCRISLLNCLEGAENSAVNSAIVSANPNPVNTSKDLAYVLYTSGSTGEPKGVMIEHQQVVNFIKGMEVSTTITNFRHIISLTTISFDIFGLECHLPLVNGMTITLSQNKEDMDANLVADMILRNHIEVIQSTPSRYRLLLQGKRFREALHSIRLLLVGGEALPMDLLEELRSYESMQILNVYGPTETTIWSSVKNVTNVESKLTIGTPIANTQFYIIDEMHHILPVGLKGELCIGGDGVGRGYLHAQELTQERFITLENGIRVYRTGDLASIRTDGEINYHGRMDFQVKIRGYRVELGEIENALLSLTEIQDAVVIAFGNTAEKELCAYYVAQQELDISELRMKLGAKLISYMIPDYFVRLDKLPVTPNGKINRKALPAPSTTNKAVTTYSAPFTAMEHMVCDVFARILKLDKVGMDDDFFLLGGNSLKAVFIINGIEERCGIRITIMDVFRNTTPKKIVSLLDSAKHYEPIPMAVEKECYPMSSTQKRMYLVSMLDPSGIAYNIPFGMNSKESLEPTRLKESMQYVIQRHEILRTIFYMENDVPMQKILTHVDADVTFLDFSDRKYEPLALADVMHTFIKPFDLTNAPLIRLQLIHWADGSTLLFDMHHIISDGTSLNLIVDELLRIYRDETLPPVTTQYKDYSEWMHARDLSEQQAFWIAQFQDELPVLDMPTDWKRPLVQDYHGDTITTPIHAEVKQKLLACAQKEEVTEYMLLLSATMILLSKYSSQSDIIIGSPVSGRVHKDTEQMIGMFVNTLAMRGKPEPDKTVHTLLQEVKEYCLQAFAHQEYPFEDLIEALEVNRDLGRNPLFDVMFAFHNEHEDTHNQLQSVIEDNSVTAKFDLSFHISNQNGGYVLELEYCTALYKRETAVRMIQHFISILLKMIQNTHCTISDLIMTTQEDIAKIAEINNTTIDYDSNSTISELFQQQVALHPDVIAIKCGNEHVTYHELDQQANRIANHLRTLGIERDNIVAVLGERSVSLIASLLGILKSGAAYLPLDPEYPADRIQYMLNHSKASYVIVEDTYFEKIPASCNCISMDIAKDQRISCETPCRINESHDLAYVIYTSGSTGTPKGVMIEHKQLVNFIRAMEQAINIQQYSRILSLTTISFDIFGLESHLALANGMTITLSQKRQDIDAKAVSEMILRDQIEVIQFTPSRFKLLLQEESFQSALSNIKLAIVGGEPFPDELLAQLRKYPNLRIINGYGPTETTIYSSIKELTDPKTVCTIGKPLMNTRYYIMDSSMHMLPVGVKGELCIGGDCVGRGYLHAEDLTKERFITLENGERIYRSGDIAYIRTDGETICCGRQDNQVKIRGYRIELGEIEKAILSIDGVQDVVVIAFSKENETQLCAYYQAEQNYATSKLRESLGQILTPYMIPNYFVKMEAFPLTPNGKINKKALPQPTETERAEIEYMPPTNETERLICKLFEESLNVTNIGITSDFFLLGGNSIKAVALNMKMQNHFPKYNLVDIFLYHTPKSLATYLTDTTIEHSAITTKLAMGEDELGADSINEVKTDTIHKLPIVYPIITSYNHHAHLLSIIGAYKETYPWVMSNYVNVFCHRDNIKHSFCDFYFPMPNEVRAPELCPWILSQKISADLFQSTKLDILDFVLNCIDQKTYVHIMIDYFYVEQTERYQKIHGNHDLLIYGYDKEQEILYCSDFLFSDSRKYTFSHISFTALREGFMNCKLDKSSGYLKGQFYLYKMREAKHVRYRFNPIHIVNALKQYVNSDIPEYWLIHNIRDNLDDRAFGLDVYNVLAEHVEIAKREQLDYIDIRLFYVLYDHKKIMKHRFEYLMEVDKKNITLYQEMVKQFEGLEREVQNILFSIIQFDMENEDSVADDIIRCLKEIRDKEERVIRSFLKEY